MTQEHVAYGPRLAARPTGALRRALLATPAQAIERARALAGEPGAIRSRAIAEIDVLAKTLQYYGCDVLRTEALETDPLGSALADFAVVFENGAVLMRPAAMARRPGVAWMEREFERLDVPIAGQVSSPGFLDGGDVLLAGDTAFVGVASRNNAIGRAGFAQIARAHGFRIAEVQLAPGAPALRTVANAVGAGAIVCAPDRVDIRAFSEFETIEVERGEELGAGVLVLGERHVLADSRFPRAIAALRNAGVVVDAIDLYDFARVGITPSLLALGLQRV